MDCCGTGFSRSAGSGNTGNPDVHRDVPQFRDKHMIYLDYNATTPVDPAVVDAMIPYLREHHGNPSSSHALGRRVRAGIDHARQQLANLLGASTDELVFTSGGSEANNQALKGVAFARGRGCHPSALYFFRVLP